MRFSIFGSWFNRGGEAIKTARSILKDRVITTKELRPLFGKSKDAERLPYTTYCLEMAAQQDLAEFNWILYPRYGLSLWELYERFPEEFCPSSVWDKHPSWLDAKGEPGYRLINLKLMLAELPIGSACLIRQYAPAHLATVAECAIALKRLRNKRFLSGSFHIGEPIKRHVPLIGHHDREGMLVTTRPVSSLNRFGQAYSGVIACRVPGIEETKR
jgi:hypothetical protein